MKFLYILLILIILSSQPALAILPAPMGMHTCSFADGRGSISFFRVPGAKYYRVYISYCHTARSNDWKLAAEVSDSKSVSSDPNVARVEFSFKGDGVFAVKVTAVDSSGREGELSAMIEHGWNDRYNTTNITSSPYTLLHEPPDDAPSVAVVFTAPSVYPRVKGYEWNGGTGSDLFVYTSRDAKTVRLTDHNRHPELRMGSVYISLSLPRDFQDPVISPDGNWVYFRAYRTEKDGRSLEGSPMYCLWATNLNTRELKALTIDSYPVKEAMWSSDSKSVLFIKEADASYHYEHWGATTVDLIRFDVDSGRQTRLFNSPVDAYNTHLLPGKTNDRVILQVESDHHSINISGDSVESVNHADVAAERDQPLTSPDSSWKINKGVLMRRTAAATDTPSLVGWEQVGYGPVLSRMDLVRFTADSRWLTGVIYETDLHNLTDISTTTGPFRSKTLVQLIAISLIDRRVVILSPPLEASPYYDYCIYSNG